MICRFDHQASVTNGCKALARDRQGCRILLAISELRRGGAERVLINLAMQFQEAGHSIQVLCLQDSGELAADARSAGIAVKSVASTRPYDFLAVWRIAKELAFFRPDIINVHDRSSLPYLVVANSLIRRAPVVFSAHGLLVQDMRGRLRDHWTATRLAAVTAVSEPAAKEYARLLKWRRGVEVIDNGVPPIKCTEILRRQTRRSLGLDDSTFVFLAVGNIKPEKGFEDLLEAVANARRELNCRTFVVLVVGAVSDAQYNTRLLEEHRKFNLNGTVTFLGSRSDMPALYSAADAFVLSSRKEGLPMVLLEAMSAGLPVVATAVGAVPEVIRHGHEGLVTDVASPQALAAAMKQLLDSPELRTSLSQAGELRATTQYSVAAMADHYLKVYRDCIAKSKR